MIEFRNYFSIKDPVNGILSSFAFLLANRYTRSRMWEIRIRKVWSRVPLPGVSPPRPLEIVEVCYYRSGESNKRPSSNSRDARIRWNHVSLAFSVIYREKKTKEFFSFLKLHRYTSPRKVMDFSFGKQSASLSSSRYFE